MNLKKMFAESPFVADVGGGKKPFAVAAQLDTEGKNYIGLDVDPEELMSAPPNVYSDTAVVDICNPSESLAERFDLIVCRNTLEHVTDVNAAIKGIASMMTPNGRCYIKLPCRRAAFARLNRILPNMIKRKVMHAIYPHKKSDGFPAFYDQCTPSSICRICNIQGLEILVERRGYRSTYFSFFFPLWILWRGLATVQYLIDPDYCESFEMVLLKPVNGIEVDLLH